MHRTRRLHREVELRDLAQRPLVEHQQLVRVYRPESLLRRPAGTAAGLFRQLEPDGLQNEQRQHDSQLHLREEL
jgi:hypothetical protein